MARGKGVSQGPEEKVDGELESMGLHGEKVSRERRGVRVRQSTRSDQEVSSWLNLMDHFRQASHCSEPQYSHLQNDPLNVYFQAIQGKSFVNCKNGTQGKNSFYFGVA